MLRKANESFVAWWKYYYYKALYPEMTQDELKEVSSYEPSNVPLAEMARVRAFQAMKSNEGEDNG